MNKELNLLIRFSTDHYMLDSLFGSVAKILDGKVDMILIGDSLGSTLYGMKNTQGVTMMKIHGRLVTQKVKYYYYRYAIQNL